MSTEKRIIGFGGVFYTEWNVETTTKVDAQGNGYACDRYTYLGNLSKDLETAKSKMRHAFEVDTNVQGEKYFTVNRKIVADLGMETLFMFGNKHLGKSIAYIHENDPSYLSWYAEKGEKGTPLFEIFARTSIGSKLIQSIETRRQMIVDAAKESLNTDSKWIEGIFSFVAQKSLSIGFLPDKTTLHFDEPMYVKHGVYELRINDLIVQFFFEDFNEHDYKGISYAYPCVKGKGKKIKNMRLNIEFTDISRSEKWIERYDRFERIQKVMVKSFTLEKVV